MRNLRSLLFASPLALTVFLGSCTPTVDVVGIIGAVQRIVLDWSKLSPCGIANLVLPTVESIAELITANPLLKTAEQYANAIEAGFCPPAPAPAPKFHRGGATDVVVHGVKIHVLDLTK